MRITNFGALTAIGVVCWAQCAQPAIAASLDPPSRSVWEGVYTAEQARRGEAIYARECASCHGAKLKGGEAPPLAGAGFLSVWYGYSAGDLVERIRQTMPPAGAGKMSGPEYVAILAHILSSNEMPVGAADLEGAAAALKRIRIEAAQPRPKL